ncbi:MAG: hypothetical protein MZU97_09465 [Bacillus subtilis]|nr:hypothetical protein [Bacillus subtilis]
MKNVWLKAVAMDKPVDLSLLADQARDAYKITVERIPPRAVETPSQVETSDPATYFSAVSPKELLQEMSGGVATPTSDRRAAAHRSRPRQGRRERDARLCGLEINHGDMPSYDYFGEKIGLSWKRNRVDTAFRSPTTSSI